MISPMNLSRRKGIIANVLYYSKLITEITTSSDASAPRIDVLASLLVGAVKLESLLLALLELAHKTDVFFAPGLRT